MVWLSHFKLIITAECVCRINPTFEDYIHKNIIEDLLDDLCGEAVECLKWVKYGYSYKRNYFVCTEIKDKLPQFEEVIDIFIIRENVFLLQKSGKRRYL